MKRSEILNVIKEEVEVVLTNHEMIEFFDIDAAALLDEMVSEVEIKDVGKGRVTQTQHRQHRRQQAKTAGGGVSKEVEPREIDLIQGVEKFLTDLAQDENLLKWRPRIQQLLAQIQRSAKGGGKGGGDEAEKTLQEAWKGKVKIKQTGQYADKTKKELCAMKNKLMNKKKRTGPEQKKVRQINFALRSKQKGPKFGKAGC
jgi:uncharacterized coiled-coil DUF342 family protein